MNSFSACYKDSHILSHLPEHHPNVICPLQQLRQLSTPSPSLALSSTTSQHQHSFTTFTIAEQPPSLLTRIMMDINFRRQQLLSGLGIKQLPAMTVMTGSSTLVEDMEVAVGTISVWVIQIIWASISLTQSSALPSINTNMNNLIRNSQIRVFPSALSQ